MLKWLWTNRERPLLGSKQWWKVWAKRALTAPRLLGAIRRQTALRRRGAQIQSPSFMAPSVVNGNPARLEIGAGSFVGRVEIHLHDRIQIGRNVVLNDGVRLLTGSHDVNDPNFKLLTGPIVIGDYAWIAMGAVLLPGVMVGEGAVVGADAVVSKDVPDYTIMVGNPARPLNKTRNRQLRYQPLRGLASVEAWLGRDGIIE
ncbi:MAG: hypothetical protein L0Y58_16210 [Verrucomicrobia subdivision 3 bacterium]|nr:hypothetical protein [Limisphaerales bacterium]